MSNASRRTSTSKTRAFRFRCGLYPLMIATVVATVLGQKPSQSHPLSPKVPAATKEQTAGVSTHELTPSDIEAFLDGLMPLQLAREDVAGATISVVKGGKVIFAKGYGYSDVAKRTAVSPDNTIFRPGSVGKLITWTAVMQQVEQGKLNLDRDINDYLDFKIPEAYGKPITLRNLMTHTPGFEELAEEVVVPGANDLKPLGDYLKHRIPARIFPPGVTPAYSNYGATLAGRILERVSGQPFNDYLDEHIFKPLDMSHSTCREPLPGNLSSLMSNGYKVASQPAEPFEFIEVLPAGSCSSTASDMAKFMIAHLQDGRFDGAQILRPETVQLMHSRQFGYHDDMNGMAGEFYEETRNGHRIIGHAGDTNFFHTDLHLVPDTGLGFFVSYNSLGKGEDSPREWLWQRFLDRYFPYTPPAGTEAADAKKDVQEVGGRYKVTRRAETTLLALFNVVGQLKVFPNSDGTISVDALKDLNGEPRKFREVGPLLFREENGQERIAFKRDASSRLVLVIDFPFFVFERVPWYESKAVILPLVGGSATVLLLALVLWPTGALLRRHYGKQLTLTATQRRLRLLVRLTCLAELLFIGCFVGFFLIAFDSDKFVTPRYDPVLRTIQLMGWIGILGTLVALYNAVVSWGSSTISRWSKVGNFLIALACVVIVWFGFANNMFAWNLLY